jgi:hypothetical protein
MYLNIFSVGYLKSWVYFNRPNNLEHLRLRIRAEMEQIIPDIIERSVQCRWAPNGWRGAISTFALNFIVNLKCVFVFVWGHLNFLH